MTTLEKLSIGMIVVAVLVVIAQVYVCLPYLLKPISEAPLLCVGNRTGFVVTGK